MYLKSSLNIIFTNKLHHMKRVTGIGGIFFKSKDPKKNQRVVSKAFRLKSNDEVSIQ